MFISIDIGGTNTRVASSTDLKNIVVSQAFPSQKNLNDQKQMLQATINTVAQGTPIKAMAVGIAGIIDRDNCVVNKSPNYTTVNNVNIRDLVGAENGNSKLEIHCLNDAWEACLGEAVLGAGAGYKKVAYLSLGTGVGGAYLEGKKISGEPQIAEPGHQIVNYDGSEIGSVGIRGTLETLISGEAFKKKYKVLPHECFDEKIWFEYGNNVGIGINNLTVVWNPDCIVIGGGMSKYFDEFIPGTQDFLKSLTFMATPKVLKASFEQSSGLVGGLVYLNKLSGYKA